MSLTEFDPAQLESRYDALDSPSSLCIRVPSPLAWGRNSIRELRAQRLHVLGDGDCGSIPTASPFPLYNTIGVPDVDNSGSKYKLLQQSCCINTSFRYVVRVVSVTNERHEKRVFAIAAHKILHQYTEVQN